MYGAFDIDSMPPATTTWWSPARIIWSAISTARIDDAQTLLIVSEPTSIGSPAPIDACRAGAWPAPPCSTCPMITYSTSSFWTPARSSAARITIAPSSVACLSASEPPSFANGVRTAETITERPIGPRYQYALPVPTPRITVKRHAERGVYERAEIDAILDEALICHVGFVQDGQPYVIPTIHARDGDTLYLHGSPGSRMLRIIKAGIDVCVTATLLDGLVLAKSVYNHSMNYRSVVVLGRATEVTDRHQKLRAMETVVEHIVPGRWAEARQPNEGELDGTTILALPLEEASAKIRTGPPKDFDEDLALPVWTGVIPLDLRRGPPYPETR